MVLDAQTKFMLAPNQEFAVPAWLERVRCPKTKWGGMTTSFVSPKIENGAPRDGYLVCKAGGTVYSIRGGIINLAPNLKRSQLTLAGWSNHLFPTPQLYERLWRRRALSLMTGGPFSVEREWSLLNEWTDLQPDEYVIDLGTSTGLYARGLTPLGVTTGTTIFAIDLAWGMLREAKKYIARENRKGIVLLRAAAENLPFHDESMDAVVVGGSLNEMKSIRVALQEANRVVRRGGRMFVMSLSKATKNPVMLLQRLAQRSGIKFPTMNEFNAMAQQTGWTMANQELKGIVLFSSLTK